MKLLSAAAALVLMLSGVAYGVRPFYPSSLPISSTYYHYPV